MKRKLLLSVYPAVITTLLALGRGVLIDGWK